jgi:hypothetical protein
MHDDEAEWEAAARQARLIRQRNLGRGWKPDGWQDPLRQLDGQRDDPLTAYERARSAQEAEARYFEAYNQAKMDAELFGLGVARIRHRGPS